MKWLSWFFCGGAALLFALFLASLFSSVPTIETRLTLSLGGIYWFLVGCYVAPGRSRNAGERP